MHDRVILVNEHDEPLGEMDKLAAHQEGLLHRAFSVFIFNSAGKMLLQQRAMGKYHSAGLWSNACCSHPQPGEETAAAASRRLSEEMGLVCPLVYKTVFTYRSEFANGLTEYEVDHVFTGVTDAVPNPDPGEVKAYRWEEVGQIKSEISKNQNAFTSWFTIAMRSLF